MFLNELTGYYGFPCKLLRDQTTDIQLVCLEQERMSHSAMHCKLSQRDLAGS